MNVWDLPQSIEVSGLTYRIRTDYRAVIDVLTAFSDKDTMGDTPEETNAIRLTIMLRIMMIDKVPKEHIQEACDKLVEFIDMGADNTKPQPRLMDWEQDAQLIIPAVNRVMGREVRAMDYCHWWTFLSSYMEIGECSFTHILNIRQKRAKGKKLEKWELEYIRDNPNVLLRAKMSADDKAQREKERAEIEKIFG